MTTTTLVKKLQKIEQQINEIHWCVSNLLYWRQSGSNGKNKGIDGLNMLHGLWKNKPRTKTQLAQARRRLWPQDANGNA